MDKLSYTLFYEGTATHPCHKFYGGLDIRSFKFGHGWVITYYIWGILDILTIDLKITYMWLNPVPLESQCGSLYYNYNVKMSDYKPLVTTIISQTIYIYIERERGISIWISIKRGVEIMRISLKAIRLMHQTSIRKCNCRPFYHQCQ